MTRLVLLLQEKTPYILITEENMVRLIKDNQTGKIIISCGEVDYVTDRLYNISELKRTAMDIVKGHVIHVDEVRYCDLL